MIYQGIGQGAENIWKGVRTIFNFKGTQPQEMATAVPAAYQTIVSNQSFDGPERPCRHPTLGLDGVMFEGSQFLISLQYPVAGSTTASGGLQNSLFPGTLVNVYTGSSVTGFATLAIPINPLNIGKKLGFRSFQYSRYRFNWMRLRLVSTAGVNIPGTLAIGYYKDYQAGGFDISAGPGLTFGQVADLVPSICTPQNVAQAAITIPYEGNELYYTGQTGGRPTATTYFPLEAGVNRQEQQGLIVFTIDSNVSLPNPQASMNVFFDYQIELYDPLPTQEALPATLGEQKAVIELLRVVRGRSALPPPLKRPVDTFDPRLGQVLKFLEEIEQKE